MKTFIKAIIVSLLMITSANAIAQELPQPLLISTDSTAQKLPNVQQTSLRAPVNIKIDGKATEWGDKFQAYNNITGIFYTMANDDKNIYFTIKATNPDIIDRIVQGGIVLSMQTTDKKDAKNVAVNFPIALKKSYAVLILRDRAGLSKDSLAKIAISSFEQNNIILKNKFIQIAVNTGNTTDTMLMSNKLGVKAAAAIDINRAYTQQMVIPLGLLGLSEATASKFNYQVHLTGSLLTASITFSGPAGPNPTPQQLAELDRALEQANARKAMLSAPADFSAEYTLATKP